MLKQPNSSIRMMIQQQAIESPEQNVLNLKRVYEFRFRNVGSHRKKAVWHEIAKHIHQEMSFPHKVLDPAAGRGEFICSVPAKERWAIDSVKQIDLSSHDIHFILGDSTTVNLPKEAFDGIFVSNFLEHLPTPDSVAHFLSRMHKTLKPNGKIVIMGPNYKYAAGEYFDFADHILPLTHLSMMEHLFAADFTVEKAIAKFLPFSFTGRLPAFPLLVKLYLAVPLFWRFFGKQFLVVASKSDREISYKEQDID